MKENCCSFHNRNGLAVDNHCRPFVA